MTDGSPSHTPLAADAAAGTDASLSPAESGPAGTAGPSTGIRHREPAEAPRGRLFWTNLNHPFALGLTATLGALVAIVVGVAVSNLSTVIIYIVFGLFIALGLDPIVRWIETHHVGRAWSIVIVYFLFALILGGVLLLIVPTVVAQITQFVTGIPDLIRGFQTTDLYAWLVRTFGNSIPDVVAEVQKFITNPANIAAIGGGVLKVGVTIATSISGVIIIIVLSLYFLSSLPTIKKSFYQLAPARNRPGIADLTEQITNSIGGYLMGMVILAFFNSVVAFLIFFFTGLPFPVLLAVVAFALTLIPLVGSVLFWAVGSLVALLSNPFAALLFAIIYLIYMQLEAYVLTPKVMNRAISIPGALVVIGALVGGTLLGLLGALVAIPVTASVLLILKQVIIPRQDAKT